MDDQKQDPKQEQKRYDEKDEKEVLKHDEKIEQTDKLSSVSWALILIWAGFAFLSVNVGWFDAILNSAFFRRILPENMAMFEPGIWSIIMFGAGVILLLETVARAVMPQFHRNLGGTLVLAAVFIGVGLGNFFGWDVVWPVILIVVGVSVLVGGLARNRK